MIFLSYASQDQERAKRIAVALASLDTEVWWDRNLAAGQRFEEVIRHKLAESECVVVLWSRDSVSSDWVKDEANEGRRRDILVPALLDDVPIPYGFGQIHTANLTRWTGLFDDAEFAAFRGAVKRLLRNDAQSTREAADSRDRTYATSHAGQGTAYSQTKEATHNRWYRVANPVMIVTAVLLVLGVGAALLLVEPRARDPGTAFAPPLSFNTGWIYSGVYDRARGIYLEGPYATVAFRPGGGERGGIVPKIGDVLRIAKDRRVIIAAFKTHGLQNQLVSPPLVNNLLSEIDETGEILERNTLVVVRDVEMSGDPGRSDTIWCRIAVCDSDTDGCAKAAAELGP